jgi:hypothetical protein
MGEQSKWIMFREGLRFAGKYLRFSRQKWNESQHKETRKDPYANAWSEGCG